MKRNPAVEYAPSRFVTAEALAEVRRENPALAPAAPSPPSEVLAEEALTSTAARKAPSLTLQRGPAPASAAFVPLRENLAERDVPVSMAAMTIRQQGLAPASPGSFPSEAAHSGLASPVAERPVGVDARPTAEGEAQKPVAVPGAAALILWARDSEWPPSGPLSETERDLLIPQEPPCPARGFWALGAPRAEVSRLAACVAPGA